MHLLDAAPKSSAFTPDRPAATRCSDCGYLRHGLPDAALCPECGSDPADPDPHRHAVAAADTVAGHARAVTVGLILLVATSLTLLAVTLEMRYRSGFGGSLAVVNFPGPKVWGAALVQRAIGNGPGYWGVTGMVAAMQSVVAIWLVTIARAPAAGGDVRRERFFSVRRLARWWTVLAVGAGYGICVSDQQLFKWGDGRYLYFVVLVGVIELPATTLLYLHLRGLAGRDAVARRALTACCVGVPLVIGGGFWMLFYGDSWSPRTATILEQATVLGYGAAATALALVAAAAIGRLALRHALVGFSGLGGAAGDVVRRVIGGIRPALRVARRDAAALGIAWGCWLWLALSIDVFSAIAERANQASVLGDLPFFNFAGPKAAGAYQVFRSYDNVSLGLRSLLAIWLLTIALPGMRNGPWRVAARWWPTIATGALLGFGVAFVTYENLAVSVLSQQSKYLLLFTMLLEVPATGLLYGHLARVAIHRGSPSVGRGLAVAGLAATTLMVLSVAIAASSEVSGQSWQAWSGTPSWYATAALLGAATLAAGVFSAWQVARLGLLLVRPTYRRLAGLDAARALPA